MTYQAVLARINVRPIPGSDFIALGSVLGHNVIVASDTADGEMVVFFEQDGQLSEEFCVANDLIERKDEDGNRAGGYFGVNRRVRSKKMRGVISEGFVCRLSAFDYIGADILKIEKEGYQFTELAGHAICNRYETPATRQARQNGQATTKHENIMFAKHIETSQLRRCTDIPKGFVTITEKMHGTSHRLARVLEEVSVERSWWKTLIAKWIGEPATEWAWSVLHGTRNVTIGGLKDDTGGYYGSHAFRARATRCIEPAKGEVIYGEIVGHTSLGCNSPIQKQTFTDLKDKSIIKRFGETCGYTYGVAEGIAEFFVYRITQVNEDGYAVELSWYNMVQRCKQMGLITVPLLDTFLYDGDHAALVTKVGLLVNGVSGNEAKGSVLDEETLLEGVVVRVESPEGTSWYKEKSVIFKVAEGIMKEWGAVDLEEAA
jgi:hypothetical protein